MSNPTIKNHYQYQYLSGRDVERTDAVLRLLSGLGVLYRLNNQEQHIIAQFETTKLHVWATTMKWREGEGSVKSGGFAQLRSVIIKLHRLKSPEAPIKTEAELDTAKLEWLLNGGTPPHQQAEFKGYKEALAQFYHTHQEALEERAHLLAENYHDEYLRGKNTEFETLRLHQTMPVNDTLTVTKVTGGWLYTTQVEASSGEYEEQVVSTSVSTTFVAQL